MRRVHWVRRFLQQPVAVSSLQQLGSHSSGHHLGRGAGLALLLAGLAACSDQLGAARPVVTLAIEPTSVLLQQGEVAQLTAVARRDGASWSAAVVAWRSEAPAIATVTDAGQAESFLMLRPRPMTPVAISAP